MSWRPMGSPAFDSPHGMETLAFPAMFDGMVNTSDRYIAIGSFVFSPKRNGGAGVRSEPGLRQPARNGDARVSGHVRRDGEHVGQVHRDRVVRLLAEAERRRGRPI